MNWYIIDMEIAFLGKEHKIVQAYDRDNAMIIAKKEVLKEFSCNENDIQIINCKKKLT